MKKNAIEPQEIEKLVEMAPVEIEKMTYEEAMSKLEIVVAALEMEGTPLALGLKLYELGTTLSKKCGGELDKTEGRMVQLLQESSGEVREEQFDPEKDGR
ncbi:MAG: exodeoxyribonuclease VII small subunit [Candidatus Riflebacteria bacterium]|nr:exodeoxyribonuclease VII small subunit [Candidatus Riflebacteria bacterium]